MTTIYLNEEEYKKFKEWMNEDTKDSIANSKLLKKLEEVRKLKETTNENNKEERIVYRCFKNRDTYYSKES